MNALASAVLSSSTGVLTVGFQGGLGGSCNGSPISRSVSGLQITNVFALSGVTGFYQGIRGGATYCFYLDSRLLALPQQLGGCVSGWASFSSPSCAGAGLRTDVLVFGNPTPSTIPVSLPASAMTTTMVIPTAVGGICAGNCVLNQTFTITRTATNALSLTAGAVVNNPCNVGAWSSFTLTNIVTRDCPAIFSAHLQRLEAPCASSTSPACLSLGGRAAPRDPPIVLRNGVPQFCRYLRLGSNGAVASWTPLQQTGGGGGGGSATTPAAGTTTTVWSGNYQTNSGCNSATCCCPSGSFTL